MIKKTKKCVVLFLTFLLPFTVTLQSCDKDDLIDALLSILTQTGWLQSKEKMDDIPEDITPFDNDDSQPTEPNASLEDHFPPIGDQGQYGTCVAWAVGYNVKTALNAIEKGWTTSQLADAGNQTSPKDLWMAIPDSKKGTGCNGTNFEPAMDALIASGAASLSSVPYSNGCTGTQKGDITNKLTNYRKIASETEGLNVDNFKGYLNAGRPIAIGAKLGDRFMTWKSPTKISSDTYNNPGMQHAYHAMALVGYDDSKRAFRVRNSWGSSWGDNGSIWVDYDFFCNSFCFAAFVAQNVNSVKASDGQIGSGSLLKGYDLLAYYAEDSEMTTDDPNYDPDYPDQNRKFTYEVFNSGDQTIYPSQKWSTIYMLYNATNAKDYRIIYEDYYTNEYGSVGDDGEPFGYMENETFLSGGGYWNYSTAAPGQKAGEDIFPDGFVITYSMPKEITGKYFLVVQADANNVIKEANEDNNFYYISAEGGKPLEFENGKILNMPQPKSRASRADKRPAPYSNTENQTVVKPGNLNAYTPEEIQAMLLHDKKTGKLEAKIRTHRLMNSNHPVKKPLKR